LIWISEGDRYLLFEQKNNSLKVSYCFFSIKVMNLENQAKNYQLEYTEALSLWKFYHDYRQKIFQYFLLFNGAFLTLILSNKLVLEQNILTKPGQFWLAIFAALTTVTIFCTELRTIQLSDNLDKRIRILERCLSFSIMTNKIEFGIQQRWFFRIFYCLNFALWLGIICHFY
jgi:hypothetical protein